MIRPILFFAFLALVLAVPGLAAPQQQQFLLNCDAEEPWQLAGGTWMRDEPNALFGRCAARITTPGRSQPVTLRRVLTPPITLTGQTVKTWLKLSDPDAVAELRISLKRGASWQHQYLQGNGTTIRSLRRTDYSAFSFTPAAGTPVTEIEIAVRDNGRPLTIWVARIVAVPKGDAAAVVSLTFDDGWSSVFSAARPIMDRYGFAGTVYVTSALVGQEKRLTLRQLHRLQDVHGWDVSAHTRTHPDLTKIPSAQLQKELRDPKIWLQYNGFRRGAEHFAYPFGAFDKPEIEEQMRVLYRSARVINGPLETLPIADRWRLRSVLVINTTPPEQVAAMVDQAIRNRDWAILVFHQIVPGPAQFDTQYSAAKFEQIVEMLHRKGVDVLPVSDVIERYVRD